MRTAAACDGPRLENASLGMAKPKPTAASSEDDFSKNKRKMLDNR
jgi:hypothetical protein